MIIRKNTFIILSLVLILLFPFTSFSIPESGETVTQRGAVNDDYYAAGGTVDINAILSGDVVVAGGELFIGNDIKGDIIAAGGTVQIRGDIRDDVRTAGGDITIDANIGDDLIASGGRINVTAGSNIGGEAWLAGGDVRIAGTVNKDLMIGAGSVRISGVVHGNVMIEAGEIQLLEGAVINGDLHYKSPQQAYIHAAAKVTGNVSYEQVEWDHSHRGSGIFFVITMVVAGIVLFKLFPGFTLSAAGRISAEPLYSLGAGLLTLIITPVTAALLIGTVLGIWVGLSLMVVYLVTLLTAFLVSCFFVADWVSARLNKDITTTGRRLISVTAVILVLGFVKCIPVIGGLIMFALLLSGLGAVTMQLKDMYSQSSNTL